MESPSIALDKLASCAGLLPTVAADAVHNGTAEVEVIDLETQTKKQSEAIEVFKAAGEDTKRLGAEQLNHLKAQLALAREHAQSAGTTAAALGLLAACGAATISSSSSIEALAEAVATQESALAELTKLIDARLGAARAQLAALRKRLYSQLLANAEEEKSLRTKIDRRVAKAWQAWADSCERPDDFECDDCRYDRYDRYGRRGYGGYYDDDDDDDEDDEEDCECWRASDKYDNMDELKKVIEEVRALRLDSSNTGEECGARPALASSPRDGQMPTAPSLRRGASHPSCLRARRGRAVARWNDRGAWRRQGRARCGGAPGPAPDSGFASRHLDGLDRVARNHLADLGRGRLRQRVQHVWWWLGHGRVDAGDGPAQQQLGAVCPRAHPGAVRVLRGVAARPALEKAQRVGLRALEGRRGAPCSGRSLQAADEPG